MSIITEILNQDKTPTPKREEAELQLIFNNKLYVLNKPRLYYVLSYMNKLGNYNRFIQKHGRFSIDKWFKKHDLLIEEFIESVSDYWFTEV